MVQLQGWQAYKVGSEKRSSSATQLRVIEEQVTTIGCGLARGQGESQGCLAARQDWGHQKGGGGVQLKRKHAVLVKALGYRRLCSQHR